MKIHCFQHVAYEGPACIPAWAAERGYGFELTRNDLATVYPEFGDVDLLVVLGGPMSVYRDDRWPWMVAEKRFILECIRLGKPVLGICLGAQLAAAALGAVVAPNPETEIGWFDVRLRQAAADSLLQGVVPERFVAFHWHSDRYELPDGAVSLASSEGCDQQAFQYGDHVLGLQFHLEATPDWVRSLADRDADQLIAGNYIQPREKMLDSNQPFALNNQRICRILDLLSDRAIGVDRTVSHREGAA